MIRYQYMKSYIISTENMINETQVPPYRFAKALSISNESERARSLCAGYLLGIALKENSIPMDTEPEYNNGKPQFRDYPDFRFNLSHSGQYAAIVYNNDGLEVGIDIQEHRSVRDSLSRRIASPKDTENDMLRLWTIKEAYSKLTGKGIAFDFTKIAYAYNRVVDLTGKTLAYVKISRYNDVFVCAVSKSDEILNLEFQICSCE